MARALEGVDGGENVRPAEALARLRTENSRDARRFALYGRAAVAAKGGVTLGLGLAAGGSLLVARTEAVDLVAIGVGAFWISLAGWYVSARARSIIAQRNGIQLDPFAPSFDPVARLQNDRSLGATLVALSGGAAVGFVALAASGSKPISILAACVAFGVVKALSRFVPIYVTPSGALSQRWEAEAARYQGLPADASRELIARVQCERRAKFPSWLVAALPALAFVPWFGRIALIGVLAAPILAAGFESWAFSRARGNELRMRGGWLVAFDASGRELAAIDLHDPFTYQVLSQSDAEAVYRLEQGGQRIEFTTEAEAAPWIVRDVLKREWPARDRAAWDAA